MRSLKRFALAIVCATAFLGGASDALAQTKPTEPRDPTSPTEAPTGRDPRAIEVERADVERQVERLQEEFDRRYWSSHQIAFRIGQDYVLRPGESRRSRASCEAM
jgi:hypothetical protein